MSADDSILRHLGNVAVIFILGILYVVLLVAGTIMRHARTLVTRGVSAVTELVLRSTSRERRA